MAAGKEFPLSLVIKAVDQATGPLRAINEKIAKLTAPIGNAMKAFSKEARLPAIVEAAGKARDAMSNLVSGVAGLAAKLAGLGLAGAFGFYRVTRAAVDAGDSLAEVSQRVGLNVDSFASLRFAMQQSDVEAEAFTSSMDHLTKNMGELRAGGGSLLEFLSKVSPTLLRQVKASKSTEQVIGLLTSAFEKVKDPAKRAAFASAAFGKSGLQMGQALGQGAQAIQKLQLRYLELSGSQEKFAADSSDLDNALRESETAFLGLRNAAIGALMPALTKLSTAVAGFLAKHRDGLRLWAEKTGAALGAWVDSGGVERLTTQLGTLATNVSNVVEKLGGLEGIGKIVAGLYGARFAADLVTAAFAMTKLGIAVAPVAIALAGFVAPALPFIAAAGGIAAAGYQIYKNWGDIKLLFSEFWSDTLDKIREVTAKILEFGRAIAKVVEGPADALRETVGSFGAKVGGFLHSDQVVLSPESARPPVARSEARVAIDINGLPKGSRVTPDRSNTTPLDLAVGYAFGGAQ